MSDYQITATLYGKYLMINAYPEAGTPEFEKQILFNNDIPGLLNVQLRCEDGIYRYFYDLDSKQSLEEVLSSKKANYSLVMELMDSLLNMLEMIGCFLLDERRILLAQEYIFYHSIHKAFYFVYHPEHEAQICEDIQGLISQLLKVVDHQDKKAVLLVYSLYHIVDAPEYSIQQLKHRINEARNGDRSAGPNTAASKAIKASAEIYSEPETGEQYRVRKRGIKSTVEEPDTAVHEVKHIPKAAKWPMGDEEDNNSKDGTRGKAKPGDRWFTGGYKGFFIGLADIIIVAIAGFIIYIKLGNQIEQVFADVGIDKTLGWIVLFLIAGFLLGAVMLIISRSGDAQEEEFWTEDDQVVISGNTILSGGNSNTTILSNENHNETSKVQASPAILILHPVNGNNNECMYISDLPCILGKSVMDSSCRIENPTVSRRHLKLSSHDDRFFVTDLKSSNGTFINQQRLRVNEAHIIESGDLLTVSNLDYRIEFSR